MRALALLTMSVHCLKLVEDLSNSLQKLMLVREKRGHVVLQLIHALLHTQALIPTWYVRLYSFPYGC